MTKCIEGAQAVCWFTSGILLRKPTILLLCRYCYAVKVVVILLRFNPGCISCCGECKGTEPLELLVEHVLCLPIPAAVLQLGSGSSCWCVQLFQVFYRFTLTYCDDEDDNHDDGDDDYDDYDEDSAIWHSLASMVLLLMSSVLYMHTYVNTYIHAYLSAMNKAGCKFRYKYPKDPQTSQDPLEFTCC